MRRRPYRCAAHGTRTVTVGSASKSFWGGLRIGWIRAATDQVAQLSESRLALDLAAPVLEQLVLLHLMADRKRIVEYQQERVRQSRSALCNAMRTALPHWVLHQPAGGLSVWCELPDALSTAVVGRSRETGSATWRRPAIRRRRWPRALLAADLHATPRHYVGCGRPHGPRVGGRSNKPECALTPGSPGRLSPGRVQRAQGSRPASGTRRDLARARSHHHRRIGLRHSPGDPAPNRGCRTFGSAVRRMDGSLIRQRPRNVDG